MPDGKVVYEVVADDSGLNKDISRAESKIKSSAKDASNAVDKGANDAKSSIKSTTTSTNDLSESLSDVGETATDAFGKVSSSSGALSKITSIGVAGLASVGTAAVAAGTSAISGVVNLDKATNQFLASTGRAETKTIRLSDGTTELIDNTQRYSDIMKSIYANNYGDSFEDIANAMAEAEKQLGYVDEADLQKVTESAFTLRDTFGYDISESLRAADSMVEQFGISADEAMGFIASGAQVGLDYSGELLDTINEYSPQFKKLGLDAEDMFNVLLSGTNSGAFNLDKIGDAVKELSIRVVDGSDTTRAGFEAIGLNADEMAQKFAAGGESAKEAFNQTVDALAAIEDPLAQNTAGVNLFGTMWEDLGATVITSLTETNDGLDQTAEEMDRLKSVKYDDLGSMFEGFKRSIELLLIPLGESLIPMLGELMQNIGPLVSEIGQKLVPVFGSLLEAIGPIVSSLAEALTPLLSSLFEALGPLIEVLGETLMPIFEQIGEILIVLAEPLGQLIEFLGQILGIALQIVAEALGPILDLVIQLLEPLMQLLEGLLAPLMDMFNALLEPLLTLIQAALQPILSLVSALIEPLMSLVEAILPPIQELFAALTPILQTLFSALQPLFDIFTKIAEIVGSVLGPVIETLANIFSEVLGGAINAIMPIIQGVMDIFGSVIDFITGIFSGNWEKAWDGIVGIFKGIFNLIPTIVEGIINGAIGIINGIISGINALTGLIGIPEIPKIPNVSLPRFHVGGIVDFKAGEGLALLKSGEMVLTQRQQAELFAMANGMGINSNSAVIVVNSPVYLDGREITSNVTKHQYSDVMAKRYKG